MNEAPQIYAEPFSSSYHPYADDYQFFLTTCPLEMNFPSANKKKSNWNEHSLFLFNKVWR